MKRAAGVLVAVVVGLAGCGPKITVQNLNPSPHPMVRRPAQAVEIYTTAMPARPYVEVAVLSASRGESEDHLPALRDEAGRIGCDALVFTALSRTTTSEGFVRGRHSTSESTSGSTATCVVWTDAPPGPPGGP